MAILTKTNFSKLEFINRIDSELYNPDLKVSLQNLVSSNVPLTRLKDLCNIRSGTTPTDRIDGLVEGPILFKTKDIRNNTLCPYSDFYHISNDIHNRMFTTQLQNEDVLLNIVGATLEVIGRSAFFIDFVQEANITQAMVSLRSKSPELKSGYLFAYLQTKFAQDQIKRFARPTGQFNLNLSETGQILIPLLELSIQTTIHYIVKESANKLNHSFNLYSQATQLLEKELGLDLTITFENQNKYICALDDLISARRIDPEYFSPKVKEIVRRISNLNHTTTSQNFDLTNGYPWDSQKFLDNNSGEPVVRIRDIRPGYIDNEKLTSLVSSYASSVGFLKAQTGDIVIGMDGIKYFYSSLIETPCLVNQRVCHLRPKSYSAISPEYLSFIINSQIGQAQLLRDMTIATTVGHITNFNIAKLVIPIISDDFHKTITEIIISANSAKKESKRLLEQAKTEVETLIEQAANRS